MTKVDYLCRCSQFEMGIHPMTVRNLGKIGWCCLLNTYSCWKNKLLIYQLKHVQNSCLDKCKTCLDSSWHDEYVDDKIVFRAPLLAEMSIFCRWSSISSSCAKPPPHIRWDERAQCCQWLTKRRLVPEGATGLECTKGASQWRYWDNVCTCQVSKLMIWARK